jgi:hypothetical protein
MRRIIAAPWIWSFHAARAAGRWALAHPKAGIPITGVIALLLGIAIAAPSDPSHKTVTVTQIVTHARVHVRVRTRVRTRTRTVVHHAPPPPARTVTLATTVTATRTIAVTAPSTPTAQVVEAPGSTSHATDSEFCSTHNCIENFPDGNGYVVQCVDGEWSHSGGLSGACSGHGGEE